VSLAHHLNGEGDFTDLKSRLKSLVAQANDSVDAEKAAEAESSEVDGIPLSMVTIDQLSSEDSDSSSPVELSEVEEFLEDIQSYNNCLYGLGRVLQDPAERLCIETHGSGQESKAIQEPSKMKAWPFIATVLDTYPSIDMEFARRLSEANRLRYNRLQEERDRNTASANEVQAESSDDDPIEQVATQSHRPSSHAQSEMTAPSAQNSSLFDKPQDVTGNMHRVSPKAPASATTFASSIGMSNSQERKRVIPEMPKDQPWGTPFRCTVCRQALSNVWSSADWTYVSCFHVHCSVLMLIRRHVYRDLQPYICTTTECSLGLPSFVSRHQWAAHEFTMHKKGDVSSDWGYTFTARRRRRRRSTWRAPLHCTACSFIQWSQRYGGVTPVLWS